MGLGLAELELDGLSETLVLGETEALGDTEALGESDGLAEAEGDRELLGETELLIEVELLGDMLALGLAEAEGDTSAPAIRATTEEPALIGFHRQTKRIRPEVIAAVATVIVISLVITSAGKFVTVLAIKVAWGLVPVQTS